nr:unnamed protein product [Callosobruchus chinensis]
MNKIHSLAYRSSTILPTYSKDYDKLLENESILCEENKSVTHVWNKGHSCMKGNEIVDLLAKDGAITGSNIDNLIKTDIISTRVSGVCYSHDIYLVVFKGEDLSPLPPILSTLCDCMGDNDNIITSSLISKSIEIATNNMLDALVAANIALHQNHIPKPLMVLIRVGDIVWSILCELFESVNRLISPTMSNIAECTLTCTPFIKRVYDGMTDMSLCG